MSEKKKSPRIFNWKIESRNIYKVKWSRKQRLLDLIPPLHYSAFENRQSFSKGWPTVLWRRRRWRSSAMESIWCFIAGLHCGWPSRTSGAAATLSRKRSSSATIYSISYLNQEVSFIIRGHSCYAIKKACYAIACLELLTTGIEFRILPIFFVVIMLDLRIGVDFCFRVYLW